MIQVDLIFGIENSLQVMQVKVVLQILGFTWAGAEAVGSSVQMG